jgi:hypothetical protein
MSDSIEDGHCDICGKYTVLERKYFYYNVRCDCCLGDQHFELIRHCNDCVPKAPSRIKITLEGIAPNTDFNLTQPAASQVKS